MQAESPLSDEVLRQALDAAPDGIAVVDATGAIVFVNPMLEQLFEYQRDEFVGMSVDFRSSGKSSSARRPPGAG